jgi:hypothetical protein
MDNYPASALQPMQDDDPPGFAECARFDARSVTGASYTIVEQRSASNDACGAGEGGAEMRYRTAYTGLPVVANDDGSFTIVPTHTRLVRIDHF